MKLHEAIEKLILENNSPMSKKDIAVALNNNQWYKKKDGSLITPYQIHGRVKNYPLLFQYEGSMVWLANKK